MRVEQRVQRTSKTVDTIDEHDVEATGFGIDEQSLPFRSIAERHSTGYPFVDVLTSDREVVQVDVLAKEVELVLNGVALGLILRGNPSVDGNGLHGLSCG